MSSNALGRGGATARDSVGHRDAEHRGARRHGVVGWWGAVRMLAVCVVLDLGSVRVGGRGRRGHASCRCVWCSGRLGKQDEQHGTGSY